MPGLIPKGFDFFTKWFLLDRAIKINLGHFFDKAEASCLECLEHSGIWKTANT